MSAYISVSFSSEVSFIFKVHNYANLLEFSANKLRFGHTPVYNIMEASIKI